MDNHDSQLTMNKFNTAQNYSIFEYINPVSQDYKSWKLYERINKSEQPDLIVPDTIIADNNFFNSENEKVKFYLTKKWLIYTTNTTQQDKNQFDQYYQDIGKSKQNFQIEENQGATKYSLTNYLTSSGELIFYTLDKAIYENWSKLLRPLIIHYNFYKSYKILEMISKDLANAVQKVLNKKENVIYIAKFYSKKFLTQDRQYIRNLELEIEIMRFLGKYKHIVELVEVHETSSDVILIMEYIEGMPLNQLFNLIKDGMVTKTIVLKVIKEILEAIIYMNKFGVVHLNINVFNILWRQSPDISLFDNEVVLLNFGISKYFTYKDEKKDSFKIQGTPGCIAPELLSHLGSKDLKKNSCPDIICDKMWYEPKNDIFSLGVLLYQQLTVNELFTCNESNIENLLIMNKECCIDVIEDKDLQKLNPKVVELLNHMVMRDPKQRPSADQCLIMVIEFLNSRSDIDLPASKTSKKEWQSSNRYGESKGQSSSRSSNNNVIARYDFLVV